MAGGLSPDQFTAIELAINATGQAGVQALGASVQSLEAQIQNYQAVLKAGGPVNQTAINEIADLKRQLDQANAAYAAGQRVSQGYSAAAADTARASKGSGQAILELSRAFEDFSVAGPLGALNNIPRVIEGIGRAAGVGEAALTKLTAVGSGLATVGFLVYQNWDRVRALFDDGLGQKPLKDAKELGAELETLTSKQWKTKVDIADIERLSGEIERLTRAERAYESLNSATEDQKKAGQIVSQGIVEATGGDRSKLNSAVSTALGLDKSGETAELEKRLAAKQAAADAYQSTGQNDFGRISLQNEADRLKSELEEQRKVDTTRRNQVLKKLVGGAASGDESARKQLADLYDKNQKFFDNNQVGPKFREGLEDADPRNFASDRALKEFDENERDIKPGYEARKKREKKQADEDKRAAEFYEKEDISNADERSKGMEKLRTDHAKKAEAEAKKATADRAKAVNEVDDPFLPDIQAEFAANRLKQTQGAPIARNRRQEQTLKTRGQDYALPEAELGKRIEATVARLLARSGGDPLLAPDIVGKGYEGMKDAYTKGVSEFGNKAVALAQVAENSQAIMLQAQNKLAGLDAKINQLQAQNAQLQMNAGMMNQRQRQRQPSLLINPPPGF